MTGPEGGLRAGLVIAWEHRETGWFAQTAYLIESDGALVTQWLPAELLRPVG